MISSQPQRSLTTTPNQAGFTLVELMVALTVSGLVMAAIVSIFTAQSKSYSEHDDVADTQQNLRGALAILPMEIRLAGCDPNGTAGVRIIEATRTQLRFTMDFTGAATNSADGEVRDPKEDIGYSLRGDSNGDGIVDNGGAEWTGNGFLIRQTGGKDRQILADNIEALEFTYIMEKENGTTEITRDPPHADLDNIRAVQVSILAKASHPASGFLHNKTYDTASGAQWKPPPDNFRRRLVVTTIHCRNLGLKKS